MEKVQPSSGHLDSSATHRAVQASTILDRRYVKRPMNSNAGKYSSTTRTHSDQVAPSRLINLNMHANDLEVAKIRETIHAEISEPAEEVTTEPNYLTEDAIALGLEVAAAESALAAEESADESPNDEYDAFGQATADAVTEPLATEDSATLESNSENDSPVSMYALENMKRNMMQDLVSTVASTDDTNVQSTAETANYATPVTTGPINTAEQESIDMISKATSNALASIRIATESSDVSDQMASLKAFANSIKSDNSPEMNELSNTIEKFANVAMKSTKAKEEAENKVALSVQRSPRIAQSSARMNRPVANTRSTSASSSATRTTLTRSPKVASINRAPATAKTSSNTSSSTCRTAAHRATPKKSASTSRRVPDNHTLEQALRSVAAMDDEPMDNKSKHTRAKAKKTRRKGGFTRFALAFGCAGACIAAVIYFVGSNIPDISVQVAAMQTGINAAYPSYIPRDYSLGDISSENGRLTMHFNGPNGSSFTLVEEKSSWDSSALQHNYVEPTWGEDFSTTHEQGVTIFLSGSDAAWVNGGILYKITSSGNDLTKKQLRNIVTSM